MSLEGVKRDWEELARGDPLWAVLTDPSRRGRGWSLEEFFRTGELEAERLLARAGELDLPAASRRCLDFGCGVGRVTRALAGRFEECVGIDISATMIAEARRLNADRPGCTFLVNDAPDLRRFADGSFDFVYSTLVLQHLPGRRLIASYLAEFVRLLATGGAAAFQLPTSIGLLHRLQAGRLAYRLLRALGVPPGAILAHMPFTPMRMTGATETWVRAVVGRRGGEILAADPLDDPGASRCYWAVRSSR